MERKQYIVTIEICSSKIVGVVGEKSSSGTINVIALESETLSSDYVRRGLVQNVEETKVHVSSIIKRLEQRVGVGKISGVYVGVAGRSLHNIPTEIKLEFNQSQLISEEVIKKIYQKCRETVVDGEILDVVPCVYMLDGDQETRNPIGSYSSYITAKMNLIVAKNTLKTNLRRVFDSVVNVKDYIVTPLAVGNKILKSDEMQLGCMLVDFGAETTEVMIYKNEVLQYIATLPMGSRLITLDITNMGIIESKAEDLKKTVGNAMTVNVKTDQIIDGVRFSDLQGYVQARVGEICANIVEQIRYAGMTESDLAACGVTIIGGGSRLNGFIPFLEKTMKLKVEKARKCPFVNIMSQEADNSDYIQSIALISTAADRIGYDDSCINVPVAQKIEPPKVDEIEEEEEKIPVKKTKKGNSFSRFVSTISDRASRVFASNDNEDDNFDDEESAK